MTLYKCMAVPFLKIVVSDLHIINFVFLGVGCSNC